MWTGRTNDRVVFLGGVGTCGSWVVRWVSVVLIFGLLAESISWVAVVLPVVTAMDIRMCVVLWLFGRWAWVTR